MFDPARMNYAQVPYIPWKGKTFNQITSSIQQNNSLNKAPMYGKALFLAPPLKIYRKEIASAQVTNCNPRISASIDEFNSPNGYLVNPSIPNSEGIPNTLDITYENNSTQHPGECSAFTSNGVCLDPATNARTRVRSAGMFRKKYNPNQNVEPYCTNSSQYLNTRGKSFVQNQFNFLRAGNAQAKPGTLASSGNEYAVNTGINYCSDSSSNFIPVYYKPNNAQFAQEGGVSASSYITRLKYDTLTNNGGIFTRAYGNAAGNAFAYGGSPDPYTIKDKVGYPNTCTPIVPPNYGNGADPAMKKCNVPLTSIYGQDVSN